MALIQGGIYLARLDPRKGAEIGKLRPVAVLSAQTLLESEPPLIFICPLSSRSDPAFQALHVLLPKRGDIRVDSYALVEHCRAISRQRLTGDLVARLSAEELAIILHRLTRMLGM